MQNQICIKSWTEGARHGVREIVTADIFITKSMPEIVAKIAVNALVIEKEKLATWAPAKQVTVQPLSEEWFVKGVLAGVTAASRDPIPFITDEAIADKKLQILSAAQDKFRELKESC